MKVSVDRSINVTHSPGIREVLMDSGVSILNFSTSLGIHRLVHIHVWLLSQDWHLSGYVI